VCKLILKSLLPDLKTAVDSRTLCYPFLPEQRRERILNKPQTTNHKPPYTSYSATYDQGIGAGGGVYNRNGRGYPHVSAVGDNLVIFNRGTPVLISGASANVLLYGHLLSAVLMRNVWLLASQLWDLLIRLCMQTQGVMHDITTGNSPGCNTNGFYASTGWDPVTGLGASNYPALLKLFMSL
jgi:tripeptidyl-peptidase-1